MGWGGGPQGSSPVFAGQSKHIPHFNLQQLYQLGSDIALPQLIRIRDLQRSGAGLPSQTLSQAHLGPSLMPQSPGSLYLPSHSYFFSLFPSLSLPTSLFPPL